MEKNRKQLTIVFVTNNYTPYTGGVVSSLKSFINELKRQGYTAFIITLQFLPTHRQDPDHIFRIPCTLRFRYMNNHMAYPFFAQKRINALMQRLKPDIIHTQHPFLLGPLAAVYATKENIPLIFTYHTLYHEYAHYAPLLKSVLPFFIEKKIAQYVARVDHIIAPSRYIKTLLKTKGIKKPITVIPSGLSAPLIPKQPYTAIKRKSRTVQLLFVGRFVKEKNIPFILKAYSHLCQSNYTLTLVGYGYALSSLKAMAYETFKFSRQSVIFVEKPSKMIIARCYAQADLFISGSFCETQGIVFAEAMAHATPVITVDNPGARDIVKEGRNGFFATTPLQMAHIVKCITGNRNIYRQLSMYAYKTSQAYMPEKTTRRLIFLYQEACAIKRNAHLAYRQKR